MKVAPSVYINLVSHMEYIIVVGLYAGLRAQACGREVTAIIKAQQIQTIVVNVLILPHQHLRPHQHLYI